MNSNLKKIIELEQYLSMTLEKAKALRKEIQGESQTSPKINRNQKYMKAVLKRRINKSRNPTL